MTGLLYLTFLAVFQCKYILLLLLLTCFVSQLETVTVQPGLSTSIDCHISPDIPFYLFWIKIPVDSIPVCIATAKMYSADVKMCEQFENHSRIEVKWNQKIFSLSISSVEQTDIATYYCGTSNYGEYFFGNGSKLVFEEPTDGEYETVFSTDEVNYAALNFGNKQRRKVQKRTNVETTVIYGAVRHQEEL
uniref:Immunoglobulin V-set domain-containing protein n=1 Tax=Astyanax mexicanus TaxID=7994 RepID=A0A8B9JA19_ASTMX